MKRLMLKFTTIIIVLIMLFSTAGVFAASLNSQKKANQNEINKTKENLENVQEDKKETINQVEKISSEIKTYENEISNLTSKISSLNAQIKEEEKNLAKAEEEYKSQDELLKERLITMYENGETSYLDFILTAESMTDFISNYYLATEVASYDLELLEEIDEKKKTIEESKEKIESSKKEVENAKTQKQAKTTELQKAKKEKDAQVAELSEEEKNLEAKIAELEKDNQAIDAKIKAAQAKIEAAKKEQQQSSSSSSSSSSSGGSYSGGTSSSGFIRPVNSYVTTGLYYSSGRYHGAVDFGAAGINGKPIYAVADGIVVTVGRLTTSYGHHIIIAHYNGLYTVYAHGQEGSIAVSEGQEVKQGQQIMRVGNTGNSTGPHLHFEVRTSPGLYANRVNPMGYIP